MSRKKHKWCREICAWANGEEVEYTYESYEHFWEPMPKVDDLPYNDYDQVTWQDQTALFRIKPSNNIKEQVNETVYPQSVR